MCLKLKQAPKKRTIVYEPVSYSLIDVKKYDFRATHSPYIEITKITEFDELKNAFLKPTFEKVSSNAHLAPNRELNELTKSGNALK